MGKYLVRCEKCWEDWVEAENEDEAMDIAEEQFFNGGIATDIYIVDSEEDDENE